MQGHSRVRKITVRRRFNNDRGIIIRAEVVEFFQRIRVLYDNAVPPYLKYRRAGFHAGNRQIFHLLCMIMKRRAKIYPSVAVFPIEILILIRRHLTENDMRAAGLVPRTRRALPR